MTAAGTNWEPCHGANGNWLSKWKVASKWEVAPKWELVPKLRCHERLVGDYIYARVANHHYTVLMSC